MKPALRCPRWPLVAAAVLLAGVVSPRADAALGEDASSIAALGARLGARVQVRAKARFAIHELAMPSGARVRELVGDAGKVFAVTWSGGWRPNLRDVMGSHYDRFIAATRGRRARRGIVRVELPGMIVVMGGYLRNYFGHVVLTDLVPAGVSPAELR